jgi:hypothetical protein
MLLPQDERGMVKITGRYKELIIGAGGENIAPVPIEDNIKLLCPGDVPATIIITTHTIIITATITALCIRQSICPPQSSSPPTRSSSPPPSLPCAFARASAHHKHHHHPYDPHHRHHHCLVRSPEHRPWSHQ